MDLKKDGYHGRLTVSGVGIPYETAGSIMTIITESLAQLRTMNPRTLANGAKTVTFQISDRPLVGSTLDSSLALSEVAAGLDTTHETRELPFDGEDVIAFQARLVRAGYSMPMATMLAGDAFGYDNTNAQLTRWINDEKAVRWRYLNASERAAENADSEEYAILKEYCKAHYPEYLDGMHIRK